MITGADIVERVGEWGLREDVVEKDYVLGWILAGIGADVELSDGWVFRWHVPQEVLHRDLQVLGRS